MSYLGNRPPNIPISSADVPDGLILGQDLADGAVDLTGVKVTGVLSIARGGTGADSLSAALVGLGNVDNTSDSTKNAAAVTLTNKTLTIPIINGFSGSGDGTINGNLGLGVTPSAWNTVTALQIAGGAAIVGFSNTTYFANNWYYQSGDKYIATGYAERYRQYAGAHYWDTAPSGTAGNAFTFTTPMTLDASGNLLVGIASASNHAIKKAVWSAGDAILSVAHDGAGSATVFYVADAAGIANTPTTVLSLGKSVTSRSISAAGTINASGADYAEYENNNGLTIAKGSIVGFKLDGTLTLTFSEAIRFGIKSANPSYVGGDTWGTEDKIGKCPEQPIRRTGQSCNGGSINASGADYAEYEDNSINPEWVEKQAAYETEKAAFEARLEVARQLVDRIAYSGKVPCNVLGATPGGYIIASELDGHIIGLFIADPDFAQYKKAVGRVNRILEDGRCEVAVIIH